ncbi:MAG: hypothetical protein U1D69_08735, partial [Polynucleobacter sp.]|nr:hypothetical protein [Polynucleobacter sp.]
MSSLFPVLQLTTLKNRPSLLRQLVQLGIASALFGFVTHALAANPVEPSLAVVLNSGDASVSLIDMKTR